ncbi:hypothetical protein GCM10027285_09010 [Oleiagrimonas citrea]|uniref:Tetratricopeptide repeat protein n=1 Tax=Oleiagrimonas citrea TaxID=1665687 RepID=A0A846ZLS8_9GAMM|nr:heme biosynthesis HemY N-terminal domain-containing protein [Oleiagrimonas citrea]NKZ38539.1 tetratricopeptide repeat protein [Oleiagrimonas citrea]
MKVWRWVLLLAIVVTITAFGWHWVAEDPGQVLIRIRGWRVQSTLVTAIVLLLVFWGVISLGWRLLRWPFGAVTRRQRAVSRKRFHDGLLALAEGRHGEAERDLGRAARHAPQRAPALLAAARAAHARGDIKRAMEALDQATQSAPQAARVVRARILREDGRAEEALALLAPEADAGRLPPGGWLELAESALQRGDVDRARGALDPLRKSGALDAEAYAALQLRVVRAALQRAPSVDALHALWADLSRAQRRQPELIAAYAEQVSRFGRPLPAMDEIESALRRNWSPALVAAYGQLQGQDIEGRLRRAEGWLDAHPGDATLLTAVGRMCVRIQLWGKARQYLSQALSLEPSAEAWETLGETYAGQGNPLLAQQCYRNALRMTRGEATEALPGAHAVREVALTVDPELRNAHGVPQLPGERDA